MRYWVLLTWGLWERFSVRHGFEKPNDRRALELMNESARRVMGELVDLVVGYGVSDEFRYELFFIFGLVKGKEGEEDGQEGWVGC